MRNEEGRLPGRPSENATARKLLSAQRSAQRPFPTRSDWAAALIDRATGLIPEYGSPEFEALDDHSPARVASCVRAAEAWRTYWLPEEQARRLRAELDAAHGYEEPELWSPEVVAEVHRSASRPTYAELCELRGEPEKAARARERHLQVVADV